MLCPPGPTNNLPPPRQNPSEKRSKFYIDQSDSETDDFSDDDEWDMDSNTVSSSDSSLEEEEDKDDVLSFGTHNQVIVSKPQTSLLSTMLQQQNITQTGLRRCQSRYNQLAQLASS
ncbi:hypothetical protein DFQ28_003824 [Apophysomyces sp. BC1034]|nr:hypothetical protein DFQ28_003824 [Apophysomyces sp. BC1034]